MYRVVFASSLTSYGVVVVVFVVAVVVVIIVVVFVKFKRVNGRFISFFLIRHRKRNTKNRQNVFGVANYNRGRTVSAQPYC